MCVSGRDSLDNSGEDTLLTVILNIEVSWHSWAHIQTLKAGFKDSYCVPKT